MEIELIHDSKAFSHNSHNNFITPIISSGLFTHFIFSICQKKKKITAHTLHSVALLNLSIGILLLNFQQHKPLPSIGSATLGEEEMQSKDLQAAKPPLHLQLSSQSISITDCMNTLPQEPSCSDAHTILLRIKLPNNNTVQRRFNFKQDCLYHVITFAHFLFQTEPLDIHSASISDNCVPKNIYSDFSSTLEEIGLTNNTLLHYSYETQM